MKRKTNPLLNKNADPNCKVCNGFGVVNYGNMCSGFGGEIKSMECMCILYKKLKQNKQKRKKNDTTR